MGNIFSLGFSDNKVRVLQLSEIKEIISKDEIPVSLNFKEDISGIKDYEELSKEFSDSLFKITGHSKNGFLSAGVLIDTQQTFINVLPVDFNDEQKNINSHILWELSNYFPDTYKNFNMKYYRLNDNFISENIGRILLIAIDKLRLEFLKNICNAGRIKINSIEIDQFAVEKFLKENYTKELPDKNVLIIGCKNSRLDFSLIVNEKLKYYDFEIFSGEDFGNLLIKEINLFNFVYNNQKVDKIFLYGEEITNKIKDFLLENFGDMHPEILKVSGDNDSGFSPLYGQALKMYELSNSR